MSRERKYRAWDTQDKYWLDPEHFYVTGEGRPFTCQQSQHATSCRYELMGTERYKVIEFTGLLNKNGKEIWEGSVVRGVWQVDRKTTVTGVVKYYDQYGLYALENEELNMASVIWDTCEVIGNIHENPELLESK